MSPAPADAPVFINLTDEERDTGSLSDEHLFDAIDGFFKDGLVILVNAIPTDVIDKLNERMKIDTAKILNGEIKDIHWNQGKDKGNVSQVPPIEKEHMYPEIYANRPVASVLSHVLGPKPELRYIRTNTLIGNTVNRQRVHKDVKGQHLSHPYAVAMNTCLVDTTPHNGSTEVWLGTHNSSPWDDHIQHGLGWVREEKIEERCAIRPPLQPNLAKGSVVLRDLRLWHAGMPNGTPETRVMLAFVYFASWLKNNMDQPFPRSLEPKIRQLEAYNDTTIGVKFVEDAEVSDYLNVKFEAKFGSPLWPHMI